MRPTKPPDDSKWSKIRDPSTPAERTAYEDACLAYTAWLLHKNSDSRFDRHEIRDVRLEGVYPDTRIVVRWRDRIHDREHLDAYSLWDRGFEAGDGGREPPNQVALLIATYVGERQPKPPAV